MKILNIQHDIEESLASLTTVNLPSTLDGLRHLPLNNRDPQVSIRYLENGRKVRADADGSYFDPDYCEVVIRFVPIETSGEEDDERIANEPSSHEHVDALDFGTATDQLLDELGKAEGRRPFVGLKWFRDQYLPTSGHAWACDPRTSGALLRQATDQRLVLTSQVPNPNQPMRPVTAIRINRRHPRFQPEASRRSARFQPIRIRGGAISDTVLGDRR
ncbi:MAG: hypothetical protein OXU81_09685 [Gammaproteobacteria bacterium]|nr:hypothetical protein [Gammaproteobacteria bacterium]